MREKVTNQNREIALWVHLYSYLNISVFPGMLERLYDQCDCFSQRSNPKY